MFRFTRSRSDAADAVGEEIHEHDLGLGHDLVVMNRRAALRGMLGAAGVGAVGLTVGCAADPTSTSAAASSTTTAGAAASTTGTAAAAECVEAAPGETAGPYPGDGSNGPNVLVESGVHRSDITSSFGGATGTAEGVPMRVSLEAFACLHNILFSFSFTMLEINLHVRFDFTAMLFRGCTRPPYLTRISVNTLLASSLTILVFRKRERCANCGG